MAVAFWQAEMGARRWLGVSRVNGEGRKSQEAVRRWALEGELKVDVGNHLGVRTQWQIKDLSGCGSCWRYWSRGMTKLDPFFRKSNMAVCDVGDRWVRRSVKRWCWQTRWDRRKFSSEKGQWEEEMDTQSCCGNRSRGLRCRVAAGMQENHGTLKLF